MGPASKEKSQRLEPNPFLLGSRRYTRASISSAGAWVRAIRVPLRSRLASRLPSESASCPFAMASRMSAKPPPANNKPQLWRLIHINQGQVGPFRRFMNDVNARRSSPAPNSSQYRKPISGSSSFDLTPKNFRSCCMAGADGSRTHPPTRRRQGNGFEVRGAHRSPSTPVTRIVARGL